MFYYSFGLYYLAFYFIPFFENLMVIRKARLDELKGLYTLKTGQRVREIFQINRRATSHFTVD